MELSRQMLLLAAENYGSYYLHITKNKTLSVTTKGQWDNVLYLTKINNENRGTGIRIHASGKPYRVIVRFNEKVENDIKEKEGNNIMSHIKKDSYVIALDLKGSEFDSIEFSKKISNLSFTTSDITFIIGGSLGLSTKVLSACNEKICFSKLTFPHQLIRIFLLEQLYRAFKIANNETYHK